MLTRMVCSLPFQIGKNVSVKEYNTFLGLNESSGYKFKWENKNVYIIDLAYTDRVAVISLLGRYFQLPNGGVIYNPPINVLGRPCKRILSSFCLIFEP